MMHTQCERIADAMPEGMRERCPPDTRGNYEARRKGW